MRLVSARKRNSDEEIDENVRFLVRCFSPLTRLRLSITFFQSPYVKARKQLRHVNNNDNNN